MGKIQTNFNTFINENNYYYDNNNDNLILSMQLKADEAVEFMQLMRQLPLMRLFPLM